MRKIFSWLIFKFIPKPRVRVKAWIRPCKLIKGRWMDVLDEIIQEMEENDNSHKERKDKQKW